MVAEHMLDFFLHLENRISQRTQCVKFCFQSYQRWKLQNI